MGMTFGALGLVVIFLSVTISRASTPSEKHRRALVIGLDGTTGGQLHYQALVQQKAPVLANLMLTGKYTPCYDEKKPSRSFMDIRCARAHSGFRSGEDFRWLTGPGWCSVLTGVDNTKHLVKNNSVKSLSVFSDTSAKHPTFMKRLIDAHLKTAAGGVSAFMTAKKHGNIVSGIIDYECGVDKKHRPLVPAASLKSCNLTARQPGDGSNHSRDEDLTRFLKNEIATPEIDLLMGVYDKIDTAGHWNGFSNNKNYLGAISSTDVFVGQLIDAVENRVKNNNEEWLVIVTADHGGHNIALWGNHDTRDHQDDAIPFIIKTFGSADPLKDLTYPVTHMDVHPTLLHWFGLIPTSDVDGHIQAI